MARTFAAVARPPVQPEPAWQPKGSAGCRGTADRIDARSGAESFRDRGQRLRPASANGPAARVQQRPLRFPK
eukprot:658671-Alexandrium_andersonii.AAC.1